MVQARHDPIVHRFQPDPELVAIAHNHMMEQEDARERFFRQRWEEALGAARVALDALRTIWPFELDVLSQTGQAQFTAAHQEAGALYAHLDSLSEEVLGYPMVAVLTGVVTTLEEWETVTSMHEESESHDQA